MYSSRIDLSEPVRRKLIELLQARLSDALDLEAQTKQAHWNVRGTDFSQLHELFDRVHGTVEELVDLVAERLTTLGGVADGRVQTTSARTSLPVYPIDATDGPAHLTAIADALASFARGTRSAIDSATKLEDAVTADVLTEVTRSADKQLWLIEAHGRQRSGS
jgi:starvation-inducible DNA-binding protein